MKKLLHKIGIIDSASLTDFVKQFIKFGIVGVFNTLLSLGIYYLLLYLGIYYLLASAITFVISVCSAYFWNSRFVYSKKAKSNAKPLLKTFAVYGSTFLLATGTLFLMVDVLHISEWIAPIFNLCFTVPLNFLLNKFWTFR